MARYKDYDYSQGKFIPIHFDRQILPGTFEYSLHYLIDNEIDLSIFDCRYRNDETGAPAYDPAILLKIILICSILECEPHHGNKDTASRNTKVPTRDDDNFLFSIQVKEQFLKK